MVFKVVPAESLINRVTTAAKLDEVIAPPVNVVVDKFVIVAVVIVAGIIGTFIPLFLNKRGIDPAIATGPFITTSNDIFGILIYFMVAKLILQI